MLTGRLPFDGFGEDVIYEKTIRGNFKLLSEINTEAKDIEKIALKMLENEYSNRYANVNEILRDLNDFLSGYRSPL
jgi:serine/threonine protein kinase